MKEEVVVITGATSGYGLATARRFCKEEYHVVITGRNAGKVKSTAEEIKAEPFPADATDPAAWESLSRFIKEKFGHIDLLINNAGGGVSICETEAQEIGNIDKAISLNLNSTIYGCHVFAPLFSSQGFGTIINISSVCAKQAWPGWSVYAAAKWGVLGFTKGLATELGPKGIRVTCLVPGAGDTNFDKNAGFSARGSVPALKAEDIADAIYGIYQLPKHVWVEEMTVWGLDQVVIPL